MFKLTGQIVNMVCDERTVQKQGILTTYVASAVYMVNVVGEPLPFFVEEKYKKYEVTLETCEQRKYTWIEVKYWFTINGCTHLARIKKLPSP